MPEQSPPNQIPQSPQSSEKPKFGVFIAVGAALIAVGILAYLWFFVGLTSKQKYNICAKKCGKENSVELRETQCKVQCGQKYEYGDYYGIDYYCGWVWPQQIVLKDSKELILSCPAVRPWCNPGDKSYENISCCADFNEATEEKTNCKPLSELLD